MSIEFCSKCSALLDENNPVCPKCGTKNVLKNSSPSSSADALNNSPFNFVANAVKTSAPTASAAPAKPSAPEAPVAPAAPAKSSAPEAPTAPAAPAKPSTSAPSSAFFAFSAPARRTEPAQSAATPVSAPVKPEASAQQVRQPAPVEPVTPAAPARKSAPVTPAEPAKAPEKVAPKAEEKPQKAEKPAKAKKAKKEKSDKKSFDIGAFFKKNYKRIAIIVGAAVVAFSVVMIVLNAVNNAGYKGVVNDHFNAYADCDGKKMVDSMADFYVKDRLAQNNWSESDYADYYENGILNDVQLRVKDIFGEKAKISCEILQEKEVTEYRFKNLNEDFIALYDLGKNDLKEALTVTVKVTVEGELRTVERRYDITLVNVNGDWGVWQSDLNQLAWIA